MYYSKLMEQMNLCQGGREVFNRLHSRNIDPAELDAAYAAYQAGDEAFVAYLDTFAAAQDVDVSEANLYLYLYFSKYTYDFLTSKGIDESIFFTSMTSLAKHCEGSYGKIGFYGINQVTFRLWYRRLIDGTLFNLNRFVFETIKSHHDFDLDGYHISKGDPCISVHIPRGSPLDFDQSEESYEIARKFFKKHFQLDPVVFCCGSWLIHPWLSEVLPENSRIVMFQKQFQLAEVLQDEQEVRDWLYDHSDAPIEDLPENTSLQKLGKKRMADGLPMGLAWGYRF